MRYVFAILSICIFSSLTFAKGVPSGLTYQGRILKPDGFPLQSVNVTFTLEIRSPDTNDCLLYSETHGPISMIGSNGVFSLNLGAGTRIDGEAHSFKDAFDNTVDYATGLSCAVSNDYTPADSHGREIRITFNDGGGAVTLTPDVVINSVPFAVSAERIGGKNIDQLIQVSTNVTQANMETLTGGGDAGALHHHDSRYAQLSNSSSIEMGSAQTIGFGQFTNAQQATLTGGLNNTTDVGKTWYNTDTGTMMYWDGAAARNVTTGSGTDDLGNHTATTALNMSSNLINNVTDPVSAQDAATRNYVDGEISGLSTTYVAVAGDAMTGNLTMNAQSDVRYADADSSNYAAIQAPATIATDYTLTLPVDDGTTGQVLRTDGSGVLSWVTAATGDVSSARTLTAGTGLTGGGDLSADRTFNVDVGTGANQIVQLDGSSRLPAVDGSLLTNVTGTDSTKLPLAGGTLTGDVTWNAQTDARFADADSSNFAAIQAPATIATDYTLTLPVDDGTPGQVLQTDGSGVLTWVSDGGGDVSSSRDLAAGAGLTGGGDLSADRTFNVGAGTGIVVNADDVAVNVGTGANQIVQLDGSSRLPAVDGSLLTNVTGTDSTKVPLAGGSMTGDLVMNAQTDVRYADADSSNFAAIQAPATIATDYTLTLPVDDGTAGQVLQTDGAGVLSWVSDGGGDVSSARDLAAGAGLTGGGDLSADRTFNVGAGTGIVVNADDVAVNVGTGANQIVQLDGSSRLPAVDGSLLTGVVGTDSTKLPLAGGTLTGDVTWNAQTDARFADADSSNYAAIQAPATIATDYTLTLPVDDGTAGQVLQTDGAGVLSWVSDGGGDVSSSRTLTAGTGLTGGGDLSADRTFNVDVGTGANQIVQLDGSSRLPAVDGSLLTNVTGTDSTKLPLAGGTLTGDLVMNAQSDVRYADADSSNFAAIQAPATIATDYTLTLPVDDGTAGQVLQTDGAGVLSWVSDGGGDVSSARILTAGTGLTGGGDLSADRTFNVDVGTGANQIVQLNGSSQLPAVDGSNLTSLTGGNVVTTATGDIAATDADSAIAELEAEKLALAGGTMTGDIVMNAQSDVRYADSDSSNFAAIQAPATIATDYTLTLPVDDGTPGQVLQTDGSGVLTWVSDGGGDVASARDLAAGAGLTGGGDLSADRTFNVGAGTGIVVNADDVAVNVGTGANQIVQLDGSSQLPAVDGSQLTGITASQVGGLADVVEDTTPQLGGNLDVNGNNFTSAAGMDFAIGSSAGNDFTVDTDKLVVEGDNGNVGIGTATPSSKLHVDGDGRFGELSLRADWPTVMLNAYYDGSNVVYASNDTAFRIRQDQTADTLEFQTAAAGTAGNTISWAPTAMAIDSAGGVGIGTTTPDASAILDVSSTSKGFAPPRMSTLERTGITSPVDGLIVYDVDTDEMWLRSNGSWLALNSGAGITDVVGDLTPQLGGTLDMNGQNISTANGFNFDITGTADGDNITFETDALVVEGDTGNVGIGTATPEDGFHIAGPDSNFASMRIEAFGGGAVINLDRNNGTAASPSAVLSGDFIGQLMSKGYGATAEVPNTSAKISFYAEENWTDSTAAASIRFYTRHSGVTTGASERMIIDEDGNVGIGTSTPGEELDVNGNIQATAYLYTSDRRLKENIEDIAGLEAILRMNGVRFDWKKDGVPEIGLIAQEVEKVLPELVVTNPETGMKSVKYGNIVAPLIESVKDLHAANVKLQKQLDDQQKQIDELKRMINALQK